MTITRPGYTYSEDGNNLIHPFGFVNSYLDRMQKGQPVILHRKGTTCCAWAHQGDEPRLSLLREDVLGAARRGRCVQ